MNNIDVFAEVEPNQKERIILARALLITTLVIVGITLIFPFTPLGSLFGFSPPQMTFLLATAIIVGLYIISGEVAKGIFYKIVKF